MNYIMFFFNEINYAILLTCHFAILLHTDKLSNVALQYRAEPIVLNDVLTIFSLLACSQGPENQTSGTELQQKY